MSAFNIVNVSWINDKTGRKEELRIQFKFGDTWQYEYHVGDKIRWGGNDIGPKDAKYVVVDGVLEDESSEGIPEDFEVYIRDGAIEKVVPASGGFDFVSSPENYIVLEQ